MDNELGPKILARGFESPYYYRWIRTPGCQEYEEEIERRWIEMYEKLDDEVENDGSALSLEFTEALANVATSDEKKLYDELFLPWDDDAGAVLAALSAWCNGTHSLVAAAAPRATLAAGEQSGVVDAFVMW